MDVKTIATGGNQNPTGRSICLVCKAKKERKYMVRHGQHWTCKSCILTPSSGTDQGRDQGITSQDHRKIKVLNLYAGIGGNRHLWPANIAVTAVELNAKVAAAYKELFPLDTVICADAHQYLLKHYSEFDFIWSSSPCQTHSRMNYGFTADKKRYPDLSLYQEIIFLKNFCKVPFVVENVDPYYEPLIPPDVKLSRHLFWSNFKITFVHVPNIPGFIDKRDQAGKIQIMDWLGIHYYKNLYLSGKCHVQVFRNCVHPQIGLSIFNDAFNLK